MRGRRREVPDGTTVTIGSLIFWVSAEPGPILVWGFLADPRPARKELRRKQS
jgi:hypothetical protein